MPEVGALALNASQEQAVRSPLGAAIVISGAGTGKTRVLTARFVHLVKELGIKPWRLLAITFTNKAAREMRERIAAAALDGDASWVNTFHAFCVRFLRQEIGVLGYAKDFTIIDDEDQRAILRALYRELNISREDLPLGDATRHVRALKEEAGDPGKYLDALRGKDRVSVVQRDLIRRLAAAYADYAKRNNQLDFADLIALTAKIFREHPETAEKWGRKFDGVLIDEFQDTDPAQYEIVAALARVSGNVFAVGDPDQSIYGWRGADPALAEKLRRDFPGAKNYFLRENYRSTPAILNVANDVIARNGSPYFKTLFAAGDPQGQKARLHAAPDQQAEAIWVANRIRDAKVRGFDYGQMAVLYRANSQSLALEQALIAARVPYYVSGGLRFFQRREIKDLVAYLRLAAGDDETALARIINSPARRASEKTQGALARHAAANRTNAVAALADVGAIDGVFAPAVPTLKKLREDIDAWRAMAAARKPFAEILDEILGRTRYLGQFDSRLEPDRAANVRELRAVLAGHDKSGSGAGLAEYLQDIALYTDEDREPRERCVRLMTVHAAKGLEFDCVFLVGLVEGLFPSLRDDGTPLAARLAEERRVLYVALTRARKELYLSTHAAAKSRFGGWGGERESFPSRFLSEISPELLAQDASGLRPIDPKALEDDWYDSKKAAAYGQNYYAEAPQFVVGERIQHKTFGEGVVVEVKPKTIVVAFAVAVGTRELVSNHRYIVRKSA